MTVEGGEKRGLARKRARNARFSGDARSGGWAIWGLEGVGKGWEGCARVAMCRDGAARGREKKVEGIWTRMNADGRTLSRLRREERQRTGQFVGEPLCRLPLSGGSVI